MQSFIAQQDCIVGISSLGVETADIVIADPPYNIGKDFGNDSDKQFLDKYLDWCDDWMKECLRVLKPSGTMFVYGFSEILAFLRVRLHTSHPKLHVRWLVWHYKNKTVPSCKTFQRSHESILMITKSKQPIFNRDEVRVPYSDAYKKMGGKTRAATNGRFGNTETSYTVHEKGALPRDVIEIATLAGGSGKERVNHPTQKPLALCETLIKACKQPADKETVVVIPFAGSGSEIVASARLGCKYAAYEINEEYVRLCEERLQALG